MGRAAREDLTELVARTLTAADEGLEEVFRGLQAGGAEVAGGKAPRSLERMVPHGRRELAELEVLEPDARGRDPAFGQA